MEFSQSAQEINLVYDYWAKHLAPKGYRNTDESQGLVVKGILDKGYTVITFENLTEAAIALGDKVIATSPNAPAKPVEPAVQKTTWKGPSRPSNVADVNSERQQFAEAVNDINSPVFARLQDEARAEFEKICNGYQAQTPLGRVDHAVTAERRTGLRGIRVEDKRLNAKGEKIVLYTHMLRLANEALSGFEKEDVNRHQIAPRGY